MLESQATSRKLTPWSIRSWVTIAFCALSERLSRVSTSTLYLPAMPPAALISSIATAKPSITGESYGAFQPVLEIGAPIVRISSATAAWLRQIKAASDGRINLVMALLLASGGMGQSVRARHACGRCRPR
jgi:hypothetical protein